MIAVGLGYAAVEGREPPIGEVLGYFEVVEGIIIVHIADYVEEVEVAQHIPSIRSTVGKQAKHEQRQCQAVIC